ncbi:hypothetical protein AJ80_05721 [Polytolypa hystricis UAMH7299]|uniref:Ubiquitin carboxyl-terminal hydrolase n=1 Tax=Polytolypa hystricis (strain UAMH7299) TaxID=1447883 RepID=A0A2B7Y2C4_POLH7|nr:hypothetical protein AJ80_05721 [Polytolypa hystricis UAMH7299]
MDYKKHFIPLESDPKIFTKLMHDLGVSPSLSFIDVYSLEDEMLNFIPHPVLALILALPSCPAYEQRTIEVPITTNPNEKEVVWLKQTINNACGLYAILHAVCNMPSYIETGSPLHRLAQLALSDCVEYLEESEEIDRAYARAAQKGASAAPCAEDEVDHHYICFVKHSDQLYELDGDFDGPINRGFLTEDEDILTGSACNIIRQYTKSEPDRTFALLALVKD